ncbi:hypothetical protein BGW80DRAFT_1297039 [Lactifluus volemus]|nr:hypothetical protein BGW80DRAFT_1297039 [Lactifluus volemus]
MSPTSGLRACFTFYHFHILFQLTSLAGTNVDSRPSFLPVWTPRTPRCCLYHLGRTSTVSGLMPHNFPFRPWSLFASAHHALDSILCFALRLCIYLDRWIMELGYLQYYYSTCGTRSGSCAHAAPRVDQFL